MPGQIFKVAHPTVIAKTFWGQSGTQEKIEGNLTNTGSITPKVDNSANLGGSALRYAQGYLYTLNTVTANFTGTDDCTEIGTGAVKMLGGLSVTKTIRADSVFGGVWNDYAEYRDTASEVIPGNCVVESDNECVVKSNRRLQKGPQIVSDTHGMAIGNPKDAVPVALCGRVLCYTDKPINTFKIGDVVCSGKDGTVSKMSRLECILFPDRILGIVSAIPTYKVWGPQNIEVNNRIWILIK